MPKSTDSLAVELVNDVNGNHQPNYGDTITFALDTAQPKPWVELTVMQDGKLVAHGYGAFGDYALNGGEFVLASPTWTGGEASALATLFCYDDRGRRRNLATISFPVGP